MSRSLIRVSLRVFAVFLLVGGMVAGVYIGITRQATQDAQRAAAEAPDGRGLDEMTRVSRDASRKARGHKNRLDAESRARKKADDAAKEAADRAADADEAMKDKEEAEKNRSYGPVPESCKEYSGNRQIGCTLLLEWGFGLDQMPCLDKLWTKESGWNEHASNSSSGAYGIPQALPGEKMAAYGDDWRDNPATQIKWGLDYIQGRYGTPCAAWEHSLATGWY